MKKIIILFYAIALVTTSCEIDRTPETSFSDVDYWNNENDLINATNRLYQQLGNLPTSPFTIDNRADDITGASLSTVSNGNRSIPATSGDWSTPYTMVFTSNNILEKGTKAKVTDAIKNRYFGEAKFFRALAYFTLVQKYGDVPLLLKTLDVNSPELTMARTPRAEVIKAIYEDLDYAALWCPKFATLTGVQYGRISRSAALALKARIALFEGTRAKFHGGNGDANLTVAVAAATAAMAEGHSLFANYLGLFTHDGEGINNKENIFVKIYGVSSANPILTHNLSRDLENGRIAPTRNLIRMYLYSDGLPAWNTDPNVASAKRSTFFVNEKDETTYNQILDNRDPRLATVAFRNNEAAYKGPWIPTTSLGTKTGFAGKKGFNAEDWAINSAATVDRILIRYGEVLLIYAEAKYELAGSITDADLNLTVNALRTRAGFAPKLTNAFVTANGLDMREEIRREREVELALEGFRYDDLMRWKKAETVLPKPLLGAKYTNATEWVGTAPGSLVLNSDGVLVVEDATKRAFNATRDYLYPVPLSEIALSNGNVVQNPNWQ
jgi:hypothetical protein